MRKKKFGEVCKIDEFQRNPFRRANAKTRWSIMVHEKAQGESVRKLSQIIYWVRGPGIINYMKLDRRDRHSLSIVWRYAAPVFLFLSWYRYGLHAVH